MSEGRISHGGGAGCDDSGGGGGAAGRGTRTTSWRPSGPGGVGGTSSTTTATATVLTETKTAGGGRWDALRGDSDVDGDGDGDGGHGSWRQRRHRRRRGDGRGDFGGGGGVAGRSGRGWDHHRRHGRDDGPRSAASQQPWRPRRRQLPTNDMPHEPNPPRSCRGGHEEFGNGDVGARDDVDSRFRSVTARLRRRLLDLDDTAANAGDGGRGGDADRVKRAGRGGGSGEEWGSGSSPASSAWAEAVADSVRDYRRIITFGLDHRSSPGEPMTDGAPPWSPSTPANVGADTNTSADTGADAGADPRRGAHPSPVASGEALAVLFGCLQQRLRRASSSSSPPITVGGGVGGATHGFAAGGCCEEGVVVDDVCRFASALLSVDDLEKGGEGGGCHGHVEMGRADVRIAVTYLGARCGDLVSSLRKIDVDCQHPHREEGEAKAEAATTRSGSNEAEDFALSGPPSRRRARLVGNLRVALACLRGFVVAFSRVGGPEDSSAAISPPSERGGSIVGGGVGNRLGGGEFVADAVVRSALLPSLEWANGAMSDRAAAADDASEEADVDAEAAERADDDVHGIATVALRSLTHLLRRDDDPKKASCCAYSYPSAVLAPLVLDVCPTTGAERRVLPNPLKRRSVRAVVDSFLLNVSSLAAGMDDGGRNMGRPLNVRRAPEEKAAKNDGGRDGRRRDTAATVKGTPLDGVAASCRALSSLVEAAASLRGHRRRQRGRRLGGGGRDDPEADADVDIISDMDVPSVMGGLRCILLLRIEELSSDARVAALGLLSSLVRNHPRLASSHWDEFLLGGRRYAVGGGVRGGGAGGATAPLLGLIGGDGAMRPATVNGELARRAESRRKEERALAIRVAEEMVRALPLRLWLVLVPGGGGAGAGGAGGGASNAGSSAKTSSPPPAAVGGAMGHLGRRVRASLVDLMGCTRAGLSEGAVAVAAAADDAAGDAATAVVEGLCSLSSTLVTRVPFGAVAGDDPADDDELLRSAVALLGALGDLFVATTARASMTTGDVGKRRRVREAARAALIECAGGTIEPGGGDVVTPLPVPTCAWLRGEVDRERRRLGGRGVGGGRRRIGGDDDHGTDPPTPPSSSSPGSFLRALDELGSGDGDGGDGGRRGDDDAATDQLDGSRSDALDVLAQLARTAPWIVRVLSISSSPSPSSDDDEHDGDDSSRHLGMSPPPPPPTRSSSAGPGHTAEGATIPCARSARHGCVRPSDTVVRTPRIIETALSDPATVVRVRGMRLVTSILRGRPDFYSAPVSASAAELVVSGAGEVDADGGDDFADCDDESSSDPFDFVWADMVAHLLLPALRHDDDAVRSAAVDAVGLLTVSDWRRLFDECAKCGRGESSLCRDVVAKVEDGFDGDGYSNAGAAADGGGRGRTREGEEGVCSLGLTLFRSVLGMCLRSGGRGDAPSYLSSYPGHREDVAMVRAAACRSMGEICTSVVRYDDDGRHRHPDDNGHGRSSSPSSCDGSFTRRGDPVAVVTRYTADVMAIACGDPNANVRTMAFFALGNLALAMASLQNEGEDDERARVPRPPLLSPPTYRVLYRLCCDALNDRNDKVVGNAIRTIGHLINMWHAERKSSVIIDSGSEIEGDIAKLNEIAIRNLTSKVDLALSEAAGTINNDHLTWKQRSAAKKHAWGACRSLAFLLQGVNMTTEGDIMCTPAMMAIKSMFRCIENATSLNPKITSAAVTAMKSIPSDTWGLVSRESTLIGEGITACVSLLFIREGAADVSETLLQEVQSLLFLFVTLATVADYTKVIHSEASNPGQISYLYQYMIEHSDELSNGDGNSFGVVGEALQRGMTSDVAMLQKFVSRGSKERRRRAIVGDDPQNCSKFNQGADDEDEL